MFCRRVAQSASHILKNSLTSSTALKISLSGGLTSIAIAGGLSFWKQSKQPVPENTQGFYHWRNPQYRDGLRIR